MKATERIPAPMPTRRIKLRRFPLLEVSVDVGDEGNEGGGFVGNVAT